MEICGRSTITYSTELNSRIEHTVPSIQLKMAPRSDEEKKRRKEEFEKRKAQRQKKKGQEEKAAEAKAEEDEKISAKNQEEKKTAAINSGGISLLLDLPEDALKHVLCELSAVELGRVSMTCTQMNRALCSAREACLLSRLRNARMVPMGPINLCGGAEEAKKILEQSLGGGNTGRLLQKKKGKNAGNTADEFVAYARFLEESVHGYSPFGFRAENEKNKALAPRFTSGRFVSTSPEHSLIRAGGDGLRCGAGGSGVASFGVGKKGQLGHGRREDQESAKLLVGRIGYGIRIVQISAGGGLVRVAHSLFLTSNGRVLSCGTGRYGALGHGYSAAKQLPDVLRPQYIDALSRVKVTCVAAGELHSATVTSDGDVYTWGDGFCGQLGHADKAPSMLPKLVESGGLDDECVLSISCGGRHTLAVTEDGEVFSWGLGHFGAIGRSYTPFEYDADDAVNNLGMDDMAIGFGNMAIADEGAGAAAAVAEPQPVVDEQDPEAVLQAEIRANLDFINNISLDDNSNQNFPMVIDSLQSVKVVGASAGHRHSLLLDEYGGVYAFGNGRSGCIGAGDNESQMFPVRINEFVDQKVRIFKISAGADISGAVSTTGQTYSWGAMKGGRIGLGMDNTTVNIPRQVRIQDENGLPLKAVDIDCGYVHSLIVGLNGTVHMCGGVGIDGANDGQVEGDDKINNVTAGRPRALPDFNIWHRVLEPKEYVKKEKYKKYGKYEVKGRGGKD